MWISNNINNRSLPDCLLNSQPIDRQPNTLLLLFLILHYTYYMTTFKPVSLWLTWWRTHLLSCYIVYLSCPVCWTVVMFPWFQLPIRTGLHTTQSIQNVEQNKECLINVSRHKFSLVINGLTKTLQSVDSMVSWQIWRKKKRYTCSWYSYFPLHKSDDILVLRVVCKVTNKCRFTWFI